MKRNEIAEQIRQRFSLAFEQIKAEGRMNEKRFCEQYGINRGNLHHARTGRYEKIYMQAIYGLVDQFGVSSHWLITGRGSMFLKNPKPAGSRDQLSKNQA